MVPRWFGLEGVAAAKNNEIQRWDLPARRTLCGQEEVRSLKSAVLDFPQHCCGKSRKVSWAMVQSYIRRNTYVGLYHGQSHGRTTYMYKPTYLCSDGRSKNVRP